MIYEQLKATWQREFDRPFEGWDFSRLKSRWCREALPWDYKSIVQHYLNAKDNLLDMGTAGGEFLLSLKHPYENTSATESWQPNIALCLERLEPLGITVYTVDDAASLRIPDAIFDIVINRHEAYDVNEVCRILKPGGLFITQQVGSNNCSIFRRFINREMADDLPFSLEIEIPAFEKAGFHIHYSNEYFPELRFYDVGAFVFWAKTIKWSFPDFSVDDSFDELRELHHKTEEQGYISDTEHRFIIVAIKPETLTAGHVAQT